MSPEVFGAWFTGFGQLQGLKASENVRIMNPQDGLTEWYTTRAKVMKPYLEAARSRLESKTP